MVGGINRFQFLEEDEEIVIPTYLGHLSGSILNDVINRSQDYLN